ncbi:MAG TPA: STAS domain-containing protein [Mycobacterium sp.]|nr:STAS domain-containing protein [Mycobacterium sp.]
MTTDRGGALAVSTAESGRAAVLTVEGVLDTTTYVLLRNSIIKAALEEPAAVLIDISALAVPVESALAVFTSARWHVDRWPEIPIALVCAQESGRQAIARNGIARYVPVYPTVEDAMAVGSPTGFKPARRRARAELVAHPSSLGRSRELVAQWLSAWALAQYIPVAKVVATTLVENVLLHTDSAPRFRVETDGVSVTIAVEDTSSQPAGIRERSGIVTAPSGLRIITALCRAWGNLPVPSGKTVWAVIGPENKI